MLSIQGLTVCYGNTTAVDNFSLSLEDGEIVTLVGPTGCGKSSVLRAIAGLEEPAAGEIIIGDLLIDKQHPAPPEQRRTGLVFQDFALFPHLTAAENIGFRVDDADRVDYWIGKLGLEDHRDAMPATLSGGQKQRVALARSLAHAPSLVLLDEPLSNLDAALKASLRWEIREALKTAGVPAIWVTHDQDEALSVGDRVAILNQGRLEQVDEPEKCYCAPNTRFVARFLGEGVFLPGQVKDNSAITEVGIAELLDPAEALELSSQDTIDVLIRPHDLMLEPDANGNASIDWSRYEGETRLYSIRLNDGMVLQARVNHEIRLNDGEKIRVSLNTRQPLAAFSSPPEN